MPPPRLPYPEPERLNARIDTERLVLEPLVEAHADEAFTGLQEPRLYRFIPSDPPPSPADLASRYRRLEARRSPDGAELWLNWMARERIGGRMVGTFQATLNTSRGLIAYVLFLERWGRGLGREGLSGIVRALFERAPLDRLEAQVDERNERSVRLLRAVGFERIARLEDADFFKGATSHELHFALRRDRWDRGRAG